MEIPNAILLLQWKDMLLFMGAQKIQTTIYCIVEGSSIGTLI
jgi:hypothetical protein